MQKEAIILLMLMLLSVKTGAQMRLVDSETGCGVAYAQLYDQNGKIIGSTDVRGGLPRKTINKTFSISHVSYEPKNVCTDTLAGNNIFISPVKVCLNEVVVSAKMPRFLFLECYFRSLQYLDSCLEYYRDGIIVYRVDLEKNRIKHFILSSRYMKDENVFTKEKKSGYLMSYTANLPILEEKPLKDRLLNITDGAYVKDTSNFGAVRIELNNLYPDSIKDFHLGSYNQQLRKSYSSEIYSLSNNQISYQDLISSKSYRQIYLKRKSKEPKIFDQIEELYVIQTSFVENDDKAIKNILDTSDNKNEISNAFSIPKINDTVEKALARMVKVKHF